jgi:pimeloyl-ACP methyl ester carboxylesterase
MMRTGTLALLAVTLAFGQSGHAADPKSGYAAVNGLRLYYEIHGTGQPLVLLHGGLGSTGMYDPLLPLIGKDRQVIAVDLQAHGRTADIDRPMSCEAMADDIAALLKSLGIEKADVMGYSLGGGTALRMAIQHPGAVRKLVLVSTTFSKNGWFPEVDTATSQLNATAAEMMKGSPAYQTYAKIAPRPADWPVLVTKTGELMKKDYDWSKDVAAMRMPTLLVFGDADAIRPAHMVEFYQLLGGGKKDAGWDGSGMSIPRMAMLPGATHYDILASPGFGGVVATFLDAPMPK